MISNHRQAWINGLRDDLAAFFTAVDLIYVVTAVHSEGGDASNPEQQQKARDDVFLAYRKILMRLNINEPLHQQLEKSLEGLLIVQGKTLNQEQIAASVILARTILKREWEVTKYGPFTALILPAKTWWRRRTISSH